MKSDFASVMERSGIKAGDGRFQIDVKGNTDLKGGAITSTKKAIPDNVSSLTTATLTTSDRSDIRRSHQTERIDWSEK